MKVYIFCTLCVLPLLDLSLGAMIRSNSFRTRNEPMQYLQRFGYLDAARGYSSGRPSSSRLRGSEFEAAIRLFQRKAHIPETGIMNAQTMRMMKKPRCGVPDFSTRGGRGPIKFRISNSKWNDSNISYRIKNFTTQLTEGEQANAIHQAFEMWSSVTPLTFTHSRTSQVDIDISFDKGDHGDSFPLINDTELAHAFLPEDGGDIHFNDHQPWSLSAYYDINLLQVALHEIGHSLGLDHSDDEGAIMHWSYKEGLDPVQLHSDDIAGIQRIYSRRQPPTCLPTQFTCGNGLCIQPWLRCDHKYDCLDESDEIGCGTEAPETCAPNEVLCDNGNCIFDSRVCDSYDDCGDGSDERNCRAPEIIFAPTGKKVAENGVVSFFCKASGIPPPNIHWRKGGRRIKATQHRYMILPMPQGMVLRIEPVKFRKDNGVFVCEAENGVGAAATAAAKLEVYPEGQVPDGYPRITEGPGLKAVEKGRNTVMACSAVGIPEPIIYWLKDYVPINTTDPRLLLLPTGSLQIMQSLETDEGRYECVAENFAGVVYSNAANLYVRVRRVPPHISIPPESSVQGE